MTEVSSEGSVLVDSSLQNKSNLSDIVQSEAWLNIAPNYPTASDALSPHDVTSEQLSSLITALSDPDIINAMPWDRGEKAFQTKVIPELGEIEKIGSGEQKVCYRLTTQDGKHMAVLLRGYDQSLGVQIPDDPKMIRIKSRDDRDLWEYSDLRTYLLYPIAHSLAVQLQEFGGMNEDRVEFSYNEEPGVIKFVKGKAAAYVQGKGHGFAIDKHELSHPKHFLFNQGRSKPPALIDIPVTQNK